MHQSPVRSNGARPSALLLALTLSLAPARSAAAQGGRLPPAQTVVAEIHAAAPLAGAPDVPQPPRAMLHQGPAKVFVPVPPGQGGLPLPASPPTEPGRAPAPGVLAAPCDFRFFMNNPVNLPGATISASTTEPNAAVHGDGALFTSNWFAARSSDSGMTWARYSPFAFFPASDGGFCCDQRALFVRNPDMMIWLLEYGYSATTQQGRLRIAFARSQADLKNDAFSYFDLTPAMFGQPAGRFLDFSDIAYSNGHLYGSAIIALPPNTAAGLVVWRANLFDIWDLGGVGVGFYTSATLGGFGSYRFAQGAADPMYFAVHTSNTGLRVFSWLDSAGAANQVDRTVAQWSGTPTPAAGPDGRDWTGFGYTVNAVLSGYARFGEVGFLWTSGAVAGRPQTFVRVARLRTSDLALIGQDDVWNPSLAFHFPACAVNAAGDVGGTIAYGGGGGIGVYPSTGVFLVDQCSPTWAPLGIAAFAIGAAGPATNRWGDYLGAARHPVVTTTFLGAGFALDALGNSVPRFAWFGRERDEPGWVDASVVAGNLNGTVALSAAMTIAQTDRLGRKDGTTSLARSYPPRQAWNVTAPLFASGPGGAQYSFERWIYQGTPQPVGQRALAVGDLGTGPRSVVADARYQPVHRLNVDSIPVTGVAITVSPNDLGGRSNGTTPFTRDYRDGGLVTITAPAQVGNNLFRWWVVNGFPQTPALRSIQLTLTAATTAIADYGAVAGVGTNWQDITGASPARPSARSGHAMVYDSARDRIVLFGSTTSGAAETWEFSRNRWSRMAPATAPSARSGAAMAYDPVNGRTLLFGGGNQGDTWSYNGANWTQLTPATSPSPRSDAALVFDPTVRRFLLFGGRFQAFAPFNDTWQFDGTNWTRLSPATVPPSAMSQSMAFDARRNRIVLFLGSVGATNTWEWNGTNWIQATAPQPSARFATPIAYDTLRGRSVLFSGSRGVQAPIQDTWEWDGTTWRQRTTVTLPPGREGHAMVYDPVRHRCVLFGGVVGLVNPLDDTWEYSFDCEIIGQGHAGGGLPLTCTARPRIGQDFCVQYPSNQGIGYLLIGLTAPLDPPLAVAGPQGYCVPGSVFARPDLVLVVTGNPGTLCIPLPNDPSLVGALVTVQGIAFQPGLCLRLTDGMAVILQP